MFALMFIVAIAGVAALAGVIVIAALIIGGRRSQATCQTPPRSPFFWFTSILFGVTVGVVLSRNTHHTAFVSSATDVSTPEATAKIGDFDSAIDAKVQAKEPVPVAKPTRRILVGNNKLTWGVSTEYKESPDRAYDEAAADALVDLTDYLQTQQPPVAWAPSVASIRDHITKTTKIEDKKFTTADGQEHWKYRCVGGFELTTALRTDILRHDREFRSQQRMLLLAQVLAGIVAVLGSAAIYLRLDEVTKGYYTGRLRLAALGFVGAAAALLFWLN